MRPDRAQRVGADVNRFQNIQPIFPMGIHVCITSRRDNLVLDTVHLVDVQVVFHRNRNIDLNEARYEAVPRKTNPGCFVCGAGIEHESAVLVAVLEIPVAGRPWIPVMVDPSDLSDDEPAECDCLGNINRPKVRIMISVRRRCHDIRHGAGRIRISLRTGGNHFPFLRIRPCEIVQCPVQIDPALGVFRRKDENRAKNVICLAGRILFVDQRRARLERGNDAVR